MRSTSPSLLSQKSKLQDDACAEEDSWTVPVVTLLYCVHVKTRKRGGCDFFFLIYVKGKQWIREETDVKVKE